MRKIQFCLLLLSAVFATGCPKPQYRPSLNFNQGMVDKFNAALKQQYRDYECYRFGPTHIDFQSKVCTGYTQNLDNAKAVRNELIENALPYIDESYMSFVADIQAGRDRNNFLLDLVDLGTAASVGITKGERTLQIIGVALTAFRGGRKSADANFYKDTSTPILISKMDGNRAKVRATIIEREGKPAGDYSLGAAVSDIVDYYNAGTLVRAFTQLQQDTAVATQESEKALTKAKKDAGVKGAPSAVVLAASKQHAQELRALWTAFKTADTNVQKAQTKIDGASQAITQAGIAITDADQRIGSATTQIADAKTPAAKATADAAKATAEADKAKAEAKKTTAEGDKTAGETAKAAGVTAREQAFKNLQGTYEAIAADSKLGPILNAIPNGIANLQPPRIAVLLAMQQRIKEKKLPENDADIEAAAKDYANILNEFAQLVAAKIEEDPDLDSRLEEILKTNK
jgi:hypothetical protein